MVATRSPRLDVRTVRRAASDRRQLVVGRAAQRRARHRQELRARDLPRLHRRVILHDQRCDHGARRGDRDRAGGRAIDLALQPLFLRMIRLVVLTAALSTSRTTLVLDPGSGSRSRSRESRRRSGCDECAPALGAADSSARSAARSASRSSATVSRPANGDSRSRLPRPWGPRGPERSMTWPSRLRAYRQG